MNKFDKKVIDNIKHKVNNKDLVEVFYILLKEYIKIMPTNRSWVNKDNVIFQNKDYFEIYNTILEILGFDTKLIKEDDYFDEIDILNKSNSILDKLSISVGLSYGTNYLSDIITKEQTKYKLINHKTYYFTSSSELINGLSYEALSFASINKLNNLIIICFEDDSKKYLVDNIIDRFESINFNVHITSNNINKLSEVMDTTVNSNKPSIIYIKTNNIPIKNTSKDLIANDDFKIYYMDRINKVYKKWLNDYDKSISSKYSDTINVINFLKNKNLNVDLDESKFKVDDNYFEELLKTNQKIINVISSKTPFILGGTTSLADSFKTKLLNKDNINFYEREATLGNILNGISLYGIKTFASTNINRSNLVLSSIDNTSKLYLPVTYIFYKDKKYNSNLINMDNDFYNFIPGDIEEVIGVWDLIIKKRIPSSIILTSDKCKKLEGTNKKYVKYGAYILKKETKELKGIILTSGSYLLDAINISSDNIRVVSVPSLKLFLKTHPRYQEELLPKNIKLYILDDFLEYHHLKREYTYITKDTRLEEL